MSERSDIKVGGDFENKLEQIFFAIVENLDDKLVIKAHLNSGPYRFFSYVRD